MQHNWQKYIELVFADTNVTLDQNHDRVIVMDLPYLHKLAALLADTEPVIVGKAPVFFKSPVHIDMATCDLVLCIYVIKQAFVGLKLYFIVLKPDCHQVYLR